MQKEKKAKKILATDTTAILLILVMVVLNSIYNTHIPIFGDEAYYWLWSKHLALSYYDHPPMVAYLIKLTTLFGSSVFSLRLMPVICFSIASLYFYILTKHLFNKYAGILALIISLSLPATQMGYSMATDDAPLIMFWTMSLYYGYKAISEDKTKFYTLTGIFIGLALLSKYTAILIPITLFFYILLKNPKKLLSPEPWYSILLALFIFSPVIYWNYTHHWISFKFQYTHGTGSNIALKYILRYLGGIAVLMTPVFFFVYLFFLFKPKEWLKDSNALFSIVASSVILIFFLYKGMFKTMEINWYAPLAIGSIAFTSHTILKKGLKKTMAAGIFISIVMTGILKFPLFFHIPARWNMQNRLFGYKQAIEKYSTLIKPSYKLCADYFTTASLMSFYLKNHPIVYSPFSGRISMLSIWYDSKVRGKTCLVLAKSKKTQYKLKEKCGSLKLLKQIVVKKKGFLPKEFSIFICKDVK